MRNLDVVRIEILRKIGSVRKVANANKLIKTKGFLMISWFARKKTNQKNEKHLEKNTLKTSLENDMEQL